MIQVIEEIFPPIKPPFNKMSSIPQNNSCHPPPLMPELWTSIILPCKRITLINKKKTTHSYLPMSHKNKAVWVSEMSQRKSLICNKSVCVRMKDLKEGWSLVPSCASSWELRHPSLKQIGLISSPPEEWGNVKWGKWGEPIVYVHIRSHAAFPFLAFYVVNCNISWHISTTCFQQK